MSFRLDGQGEVIVTDANWRDFVQPASGDDGPAYVPRDYAEAPRGCYEGSTTSFVDALKWKWPRETWKERAKELEATKTYLTGSYPLRFDGNGPIASILVGMQMLGLSADYPKTRNDKVNAVTMEDISRVAKRLLKPENLSFVVVGEPTGVEATE